MVREPMDWDLPEELNLFNGQKQPPPPTPAPPVPAEPRQPTNAPLPPGDVSDLQDLFSENRQRRQPPPPDVSGSGPARPPTSRAQNPPPSTWEPVESEVFREGPPRSKSSPPASLVGPSASGMSGKAELKNLFDEQPRTRRSIPLEDLVGPAAASAPPVNSFGTGRAAPPGPFDPFVHAKPQRPVPPLDPLESEAKAPARAAKTPAKPEPPATPAAPLNPFAELLLNDLHKKLATVQPKDLVAAAMNRTADRLDRKIAAKSAAFVEQSKHAQSDLKGVQDIPLDVEFHEGHDPREDEPWFKELPPEEQDRLHRQWQVERTIARDPQRDPNRFRLSVLLQGMLAFAVSGVPLALFIGPATLVSMLLLGVIAGVAFNLVSRTRFTCAMIGAALFCVGNWHLALDRAAAATVIFSAVLATTLCALVGMNREMKLAGGFSRD